MELAPKTIHIKENEKGHSYKNLFGDYINGAKKIEIVDPFIRMDHQMRNLIAFVELIDASSGQVDLTLVTTAEDEYQQQDLTMKYKEIRKNLEGHGINFTFRFDPNIHDRSIRLDNGWTIHPGRGLDIFQKPESKYELSLLDQTKRKCRETDIIIQKMIG